MPTGRLGWLYGFKKSASFTLAAVHWGENHLRLANQGLYHL
jgi:hypothetical protein